jgi:hypothetical protein
MKPDFEALPSVAKSWAYRLNQYSAHENMDLGIKNIAS